MTGFRKHVLGYIALALVCALTATAVVTFNAAGSANAETVVLTSPFTEAVAKVRDSVVGVNNYQLVTYSNSNGGSYYNDPWSYFFGNGNGYGYGYGYGNGGRNNPGGQDSSREIQSGSGSGVVVAKDYVLTNYHVVDGASSLKISVLRDGDTEATLYDATVAASDESKDVAVLYVPNLPLEPVELGDSDQLVVGDWAICIGNPGNGRNGDRRYYLRPGPGGFLQHDHDRQVRPEDQDRQQDDSDRRGHQQRQQRRRHVQHGRPAGRYSEHEVQRHPLLHELHGY